MKRVLLLLGLVMAMFLPTLAQEIKTVTWEASSLGSSNINPLSDVDLFNDGKKVAAVTFDVGASSSVPNYRTDGCVRVYSKNTMTIEMLNGRKLKKVKLTAASSNPFINGTTVKVTLPTTGEATIESLSLTWTASDASTTTFVMTPKSVVDITSIEVVYEDVASIPLEYQTNGEVVNEVTVQGLNGAFTQPELIKNTTADVTFTSSNEDVATVDAEGNVTLKWYGTTTIKATSPAIGATAAGQASYGLTVVDDRKEATLTFANPSMRIALGATAKNELTAVPADAASLVVYESSDTSVATVAEDGTVTALKDGVCVITASIPLENTAGYKPATKQYNVKVNDPNVLEENFDFTKFEYGMYRDDNGTFKTRTLIAEGDPVTIDLNNGTSGGFRLYASGLRFYKGESYMTFKAEEGYVITSIVYNFAENIGVKFGDGAQVNGKNQSWSGEAAEVKATVSTDAASSIALRSVLVKYKKVAKLSFNAAEYNTNYGESFATPVLTSNSDGAISYTSSNTAVATVDATTGKITLVAPGVTVITAKSAATDTYTAGEASFTLNVGEEPRVSLTLTFVPASGEVQLRKTLNLNLTVAAPEGETLGQERYSVVYTSADEAIATVTEAGVVTGVSLGKTTITASVVSADDHYYAEEVNFTLTVVDNRAQVALAFDPANSTVKLNEEATLDLKSILVVSGVEDSKVNEVKALVEYEPSNSEVATVDENGIVTGLKHGTCTITATIADGDETYKPASATFTLKVVDPNVPVYTLVTDAADIVPNGQYVIIGRKAVDNEYYGMAAQGATFRNIEKVSVAANKFEFFETTVAPFTLVPSDSKYLIKVNEGYLNIAADAANVTTVSAANATAVEISMAANNMVNIFNGTKYLRFNFNNNRVVAADAGAAVNGSLYKLPATGLYAPVMSVEENEITLALNTNGDPDAKIYYTVDGENETEYTAPFTVDKVGSVVSAYTKSGDATSAAVTETIVWVKGEFASLTELYQEGTENSDVTLNFTLTALYQNGEYLYVKDAEKNVLIKGATNTYAIGEVIPAGSTVTYTKANGVVILEPAQLAKATEPETVTVEPVVYSNVAVVNADNAAVYMNLNPVNVAMEDTYNGTISKGTLSVKLYNQFGLENIPSAVNLTVKGFVDVTEEGVRFLPTEVYAEASNQVPGDVILSVAGVDQEAENNKFSFPMGTVVTFTANYASSYKVAYNGVEEENPIEADHFTYKLVKDVEIKVTPLNAKVETEVEYTFDLTADVPTPEMNVTYKEKRTETIEGTSYDVYEVDANTVATFTCALADKIKYSVNGGESSYVEGNTLNFTVTENCELLVEGVYLDGNNEEVSYYITPKFEIYVPKTDVLDFTTNGYGLTINGTIDDFKTLTGTVYSYQVNNGTVRTANRLRFYEADDDNAAGAITATAPDGYVMTAIQAGTISNGNFTAYTGANAARFTEIENHGLVSRTLTYTYKSTTGSNYIDVPAVKVTIKKFDGVAPDLTKFNPDLVTNDNVETLGHDGIVIREGLVVNNVQMYDVWIKLPENCFLYYKYNGSASPSNAPRRAATNAEDGYTQATPLEANENLPEDVHRFSVPAGNVSYYAAHPASGTTSEVNSVDVNDSSKLTTGVENIVVDGAEEGVYYNLQGLRVVNPGAGVYIKIVDGKAVKVVL